MSHHIAAKNGEIADFVLLPGDPLRAKFVADTFLSDVVCYTSVRNMLGFTGTFQGNRVSVQGTGMGQPSLAIYCHELINYYGVKKLVRIGSCGAMKKSVKLRDIILAMGACSDSAMNKLTFSGMDFSAIADFGLLSKAHNIAQSSASPVHVGNVLATDTFYALEGSSNKVWTDHQVLAVEMESNALYTMAARFGAKALSILTVSDSLVTGENLPAKDRESTFSDMAEIGLKLALES